MAVGITIGQFVTTQLEAQRDGVFDEIICRKITVVVGEKVSHCSMSHHHFILFLREYNVTLWECWWCYKACHS
ncbi:hypothetical protein F4X33_01355 [Candidatus Poribacteria bacterium]|nr:hypothetical protein [Candidatus Poribacteria bacterium]